MTTAVRLPVRDRDSVWEAIFMLVVLKIPIVYLVVVVWWAVRRRARAWRTAVTRRRVLAPLDAVRLERLEATARRGRRVADRVRSRTARPHGHHAV